MQIYFHELPSNQEPFVREALKEHTLTFSPHSLGEAGINPETEVLCIFVHCKITPEVLEKLPNLKLICTMSTGFDHIDIKACISKGVTVCNVPFYGGHSVAEHAFSLLLALSRKIPQSIIHLGKKKFIRDELKGFDLSGKTLGVLGAGHIGQYTAKIAKGFDMEVVAYDVFPNQSVAAQIGFSFVDLPTLISTSDIISVHAPYNQYTHHTLNMQNIHQVKKGCTFINTARGGLIETKALLIALQEGIFSGAGLDVLEEEDLFLKPGRVKGASKEQKEILRMNKEILELPNVLFTPHNAFNTVEAEQRIVDVTVKNIQACLAGSFINIVKPIE
ncbi:MAG: NAD(P)-dependent oxidoreductase [Nanoarchaeota archaeon]